MSWVHFLVWDHAPGLPSPGPREAAAGVPGAPGLRDPLPLEVTTDSGSQVPSWRCGTLGTPLVALGALPA